MKSIAIITARGGSKRIPQKNIKDFCGKPIIAYSIEAAIESSCFDTVMVSTDSREIASIARKYGAEVPFLRSAETSNDYATTTEVIYEVLNMYKKNGIEYETVGCIYPTAPFVTAKKLQEAVNLLASNNCDSVVPVVAYSFPPQRANVIRNGKLQYQHPEYMFKRSQDLEKIYHDCGQFYICKVETFMKNKKLITDNTVPIIMPEEEVQDIDNMSDWIMAEMKYKAFML